LRIPGLVKSFGQENYAKRNFTDFGFVLALDSEGASFRIALHDILCNPQDIRKGVLVTFVPKKTGNIRKAESVVLLSEETDVRLMRGFTLDSDRELRLAALRRCIDRLSVMVKTLQYR